MVKLCKVIKNNAATTVVEFDAKEIQIPAIKKDAKHVWIAFENGKYFVTDEKYAENARKREDIAAQARKRSFKKTTEIDEVASKNEDVHDEA